MIRRISNTTRKEEINKIENYQSLLEKLIILLISKGILSKEDYDNLRK